MVLKNLDLVSVRILDECGGNGPSVEALGLHDRLGSRIDCPLIQPLAVVGFDVELPEGVEMVMPGDNLKFKVELIAPIAMEEGLRFAIREGGRTVGAGVVSKILD